MSTADALHQGRESFGRRAWAEAHARLSAADRAAPLELPALVGEGHAEDVGLITDGRFSGGTYGMVVGHVAPEAAVGGAIALVKEGDSITIDADQRLLQVNVSEEELARRRAAWRPPERRYTRGILAKYAAQVSSASHGAVTD